MDFCARCGQQAQPGQPFCPRCGLALRAQPPGFPPPYQPPGPPGRGGPGGPPRDGRPQLMVIAAIVLSAVAAGAVVALILVRSPGLHSVTGSTAPASEQAAAQSLSRLLTQSISDRSAILSAYNDVPTYRQDEL